MFVNLVPGFVCWNNKTQEGSYAVGLAPAKATALGLLSHSSEFSECRFISVFPLLAEIKINLFVFFWNICVKITFLGRIVSWPFFPKAPKPYKFSHGSSTPSTVSPLSPNRTQLSIIYTAGKSHGVHTPSPETQFHSCPGNTILHFH